MMWGFNSKFGPKKRSIGNWKAKAQFINTKKSIYSIQDLDLKLRVENTAGLRNLIYKSSGI